MQQAPLCLSLCRANWKAKLDVVIRSQVPSTVDQAEVDTEEGTKERDRGKY